MPLVETGTLAVPFDQASAITTGRVGAKKLTFSSSVGTMPAPFLPCRMRHGRIDPPTDETSLHHSARMALLDLGFILD